MTRSNSLLPFWKIYACSTAVGILLLSFLLSCSRPATNAAEVQQDPATRLRNIPPASPEQYLRKNAVKDWKNPYLIVREDGIGLVDLSNNEIHILKPDEVLAALAALSPSAWPYGRVVFVTASENAGISESSKIQIRKNRALLAGTLKESEVAINWGPADH